MGSCILKYNHDWKLHNGHLKHEIVAIYLTIGQLYVLCTEVFSV